MGSWPQSGASVGLRGPSVGLKGPSAGLRGPFVGLKGPFAGLRVSLVGLRGPSVDLRGSSVGLRGSFVGKYTYDVLADTPARPDAPTRRFATASYPGTNSVLLVSAESTRCTA